MRNRFKKMSFPVAMVIVLLLPSCSSLKKDVPKASPMPEEALGKGDLNVVEESEVKSVRGLNNIHFDFDKDTLRPEAVKELKKIGSRLNENPTMRIRIEGNCDERGTNEYNLALGERRANSAKKYLVNLGISTDRISTISYGEEKPADSRSNEEAWAKNRRDEFKTID